MPAKRILILGGTGEARLLAVALSEAGFDVITSLAGVTTAPQLPIGATRLGGFGGIEGLLSYLKAESIAAMVDATHPFAAQMSFQADAAARSAGLTCVRLERSAWQPEPADTWIEAATIARAVAALPREARVMASIGRKEIGAFFNRSDLSGLARMIEAPGHAVPQRWTVILARPPFSIEQEVELLAANSITHLVSKNAGGDATRAKLIAARERNIPVVMVRRPQKPTMATFNTVMATAQVLVRALSA